MLVLHRRPGEGIRILTPDGKIIWLKIVEVDGGSVQIGVECNREIQILRGELLREERAVKAC